MKYAVVDLGSNTIRLSVYRPTGRGGFELLFSEKQLAGLANFVHDGVMSRDGILRACDVLRGFQHLLGQFNIPDMSVFATASLRNIQNTEEALAWIARETGVDVEVLSGREEAELGYYGALHNTHLEHGVLFDIGGGSTEIVTVRDSALADAESISVGSLHLFIRYVSDIWPKRTEVEEIKACISGALAAADLPRGPMKQMCGIGGTARAVLKIVNEAWGQPDSNRLIQVDQMHEITALLLEKDSRARGLILRKCPDRIHTILPGALWMDALVRALCDGTVFVSQYGVREGYLCRRLMRPTT